MAIVVYLVERNGFMIFIGGISTAFKQLVFSQMIACPSCGRLTRLEIFMRYTYFSFFFIPLFKWGKEYYGKMNCCEKIFPIDKELGKKIERGDAIQITESDLHIGAAVPAQPYCCHCGAPLDSNFVYCPICGNKQ